MPLPSPIIVLAPPEVIEHALTFCHPYDVNSFALTCHFARTVVYGPGSSHLWRQLYLLYPFDDPGKSLKARHDPAYILRFDWKFELHRRIKASRRTAGGQLTVSRSVLRTTLETYLSVVQGASLTCRDDVNMPSHDLRWLATNLAGFEARPLNPTYADNVLLQLLAKLRSCFALSFRHLQPSAFLDGRRAHSRCYVYDLRNYGHENDWGPFLCGGQVNWIHVEAIMIVVLRNLVNIPHRALTPPLGLYAARGYSAPGSLARDNIDWAGVEGTWARYVSFMDYRILREFNNSAANGHSMQSFFDNLPEAEATLLFKLELRLVQGYGLDAPYPPLHFIGTPKGNVWNHASVEGTVTMGADGVVRWRFTSIYDAMAIWCSEGVQLGNVASALGVVGTWSGGGRRPGVPVGPFWMWRVRGDEFPSLN